MAKFLSMMVLTFEWIPSYQNQAVVWCVCTASMEKYSNEMVLKPPSPTVKILVDDPWDARKPMLCAYVHVFFISVALRL